MNDERLEQKLLRALERDMPDQGAADRVLAKLAGTLPPQKPKSWRAWPGILLDWQFAPAWPRVAALAGCAVLGFAIGISGLDGFGAPGVSSVAANDLTSVVFEPEPLTGIRP